MKKNNAFLDMESQIKKLGYRMTKPRQMVFKVLTKTTEHLLAKEIYLDIQKKHPDIGLTTIYRTLEILAKIGLINKFCIGDGQSRYELGWDFKEHHHHMICRNCGKIIDYKDFINEEITFFNRIEKFLSKNYKFAISNHEVFFYGTCDSCK
jgi:Fur family ferric uptake transcriptional regulator